MQTEILRFRATAEFRAQLENAAENLDMTMSDLIRESVDLYVGRKIKNARAAFLSRMKPFLEKTTGDTAEKKNSRQLRLP